MRRPWLTSPRRSPRRAAPWAALAAVCLLLVAGCEQKSPPPTLDGLLQAAGKSLQQGEFESALKTVREAETLDPQSPRPLLVRGSILLAADRFDEAGQAYDTAADLALVQRQHLLDHAQNLVTDAAPDKEVTALRRQAADALQTAARAAFGAVVATPDDERRGDRATRLWEQRIEELTRLFPDANRDLLHARLHLALTTALRGHRIAALSQLEMLGAHHPDYTLRDYWRGLIESGQLRAVLTAGGVDAAGDGGS